MKNTLDYNLFFKSVFKIAKKKIDSKFTDKSKDELSYHDIALKNIYKRFPCNITIQKVDVRKLSTEYDYFYILKIDLDNNNPQIIINDQVVISELESIQDDFEIGESLLDHLKRFDIMYWDSDCGIKWYWYIPENDLDDADKFAKNLIFYSVSAYFQDIPETFNEQIDYNKKYNLKSDPLFNLHDLIHSDEKIHTLVDNRKHISFLKQQDSIRHIKLSPNVPEAVSHVFDLAKKLYIYSYYEPSFERITDHYLMLAIESAMRVKYYKKYNIDRGTFIKMKDIRKKLISDGSIRKYEGYAYEASMKLRNMLSHITDKSGGFVTIKHFVRTAFLINQVFEHNKYEK